MSRAAKQFVNELEEVIFLERLEMKPRPQSLQLVDHRFFDKIIAGHDSDRQMGVRCGGSQLAQKLQTVGHRKMKIEDDG